MTDLPYAQPMSASDPKKDDPNINNNGSEPAVPIGSSGTFSEKPPIEPSFSPEISPSPENLRSPESIPIPKPEVAKSPKDEIKPDTHAKTQTEAEKVVDKTSEITTLHDVKPTKDKLTIEADEEEERFIEEVEKHHGNL